MALVFASSGCSRATASAGAMTDGSAGSNASASAVTADGASSSALDGTALLFSLPIAGARIGGANAPAGTVIGAGLSVATRSIVAARLDASGKPAWAKVAIPEVAWSADAELHAWPLKAGAAIVWRGPLGKKSGHVAVVIAPDGRVVDGPFDVGSLVCATDDGLAWSEAAPNDATRVHLRTYASASQGALAPRDVTGPVTMADFTLACGAHRAFAVIEGDEASPTKILVTSGVSLTVGEGREATIAPMALGRDEERDLFAFVDGVDGVDSDELGLVRIASGGEVQAATLHEGSLNLIHAEKARVVAEDDVVGVDADPRQVVVVTTHDESDACPNGRGGSSVHALRISRQPGGGSATSLRVAPAACGKDVGPFWTNTLARSVVVAWAERSSRPAKTSAPVTGLAYRVLDEGATTSRIAAAADAIADAGCDEARCYAVALVREPGRDGMTPEAISVISYP